MSVTLARWVTSLMAFMTCSVGLVPVRLVAQEWPTTSWDRAVDSALVAGGIPGMAALVVVGDDIVLARGYGVQRLGGSTPVSAQTHFQIGSLTKAVTATAAAILVGEGSLSWDDPIQEHLPDFRLADPWVASHLTLRDALALRGGIPGGDTIALFSPRTRPEIRAATQKLEAPLFRATYGASANLMYFLAGEVVSAAAGASWDEFVADRLFGPLGMSSTTTYYDQAEEWEDYAWPHLRVDGQPQPADARVRADNVAAAGGTVSNALDWARWVRFQLDEGVADGRRLVDREALEESFRPQSILTPAYQGFFNPDALLNAYGLGWVLSEYRGHTLVEHGGALPGFASIIALVREQGIGIVLMSNLDLGAAIGTLLNLKFRILDDVLDRLEAM